VLILATAIAGPLTIASRGLNAALVAKDQTVAYYLAQDAVEYIRYKRDSACLVAGSPCGSNWLATVPLCTSANGCYVNTVTDAMTPCASGCPNVLKYDPNTHVYGYTTGSATTFQRSVVITKPAADEAKLTVSVSWTDTAGAVHPPVTVTEELFNWE
jgi:hypothetical protein